MGQRHGDVGSRFGKGEMCWHLPGKADPAPGGDEAGQTAKGRNRLGRFVQNQLGFPAERVISVRVVLCRVGPGCLSMNPYAHDPSLKATFFSYWDSG